MTVVDDGDLNDRVKQSNRKEPKDAILRQWVMLQLIPREPDGITAQQLRKKLAEADPLYDVHKRTIERNLIQLMSVFPSLDYDESQAGGNRWYWQKDTVMDVPKLDAKTALMFLLAEAYLTPVLPRATLGELKPHFRQAKKTLREVGEHTYTRWPDKVKIIQNSIQLRHPDIDPEVLAVVYDALFEDRRFQARYRVRSGEVREYVISPRGLVFRDGVIYAVCTMSDHQDIRQLPLHRMISAVPLDTPIIPLSGFRLDEYVKSYFDYPLRALQANADSQDVIPDNLRLSIALTPTAAVHLQESPLSADQIQHTLADDRIAFTATVANTERLRWWLLSYGDGIEVLEPPVLREEITVRIKKMSELYLNTN